MKTNKFVRVLAAVMVFASLSSTTTFAANDLKEILKQVSSKSSSTSDGDSKLDGLGKIGGLISGLVASSDFDIADLQGTWQYQGPAISFASDNALQKVGGAAAATTIEKKIKPYYEKAGLSGLTITVESDSTFTMKLRKTTLKGTVSKSDNGNLTFNFSALGKINLGKVSAHGTKAGDSLSLTFDISKLVSILKGISSVANVSSLNTATQLLSSYDGIYAGFKLKALKE